MLNNKMKVIYQQFLTNNFVKFIKSPGVDITKHVLYFDATKLDDIKMTPMLPTKLTMCEQSMLREVAELSKSLLSKDHLVFNSPVLDTTVIPENTMVFMVFRVKEETYIVRAKQLENGQIEMDTFIDRYLEDYDDGSLSLNTTNVKNTNVKQTEDDEFSISLSSSDDEEPTTKQPTSKQTEILQINEPTWKIQKTEIGQRFIKLCRNALNDPKVFKDFRNDVGFTSVMIGQNREAYIKEYIKEYMDTPIDNQIMELDMIGNQDMPSDGGLSALYYRHFFTAREILGRWSDVRTIVEIGSGHGGLAGVLSIMKPDIQYTLIDLPIVNEFSKRYIPKKLQANMRWMDCNAIMPRKYDLLISEFTLSELTQKMYEDYYKNVIQYCKNAYLVMNFWDTKDKEENKEGLKKIYNSVEETKEFPPNEWANYVLICQQE